MTASANEVDEQYKTANLKRGAQLYDNWPKASDQNVPVGVHPLFTGTNKIAAEKTWNCSTCHGYGYRTAAGEGSVTIYKVTDKAASDIYAKIKGVGTQHDFGQYLTERELLALTRFLKEGIYDFAAAINNERKITGNINAGGATFGTRCAPCHSGDGNRYDFDHEQEGVQGLGYLADNDPEKAFHRTLWGKPGTGMPSAIVDFEKRYEDVVDVLTYTQSLEN